VAKENFGLASFYKLLANAGGKVHKVRDGIQTKSAN
jgi:hypothetical protein